MKLRLLLYLAMTSLLIFTFMGSAVYAADGEKIPELPHSFSGNLYINDKPAPAGTVVEARGEGVLVGVEGNPVVTTETGKYGGTSGDLIVQGPLLEEGNVITFYVNGVKTDMTAAFKYGSLEQLDLSVTIQQSPSGGGGSQGSQRTLTANFFGKVYTYNLNSSGALMEAVSYTSDRGQLALNIAQDTVVKNESGNILETLSILNHAGPPAPPSGKKILGSPLDFTPDGASFSPAMTVKFGYQQSDVPSGVAEKDLAVEYFDDDLGKWVKLPGNVDETGNTITVQIAHFCCYAILYPEPPGSTATNKTTSPAASSAATSPAATAPLTATSPAVSSPVTSTTTPAQETYTSPSAPPDATGSDDIQDGTTTFNTVLIGVIIGGVVIVGCLIGVMIFRNRRSK